MDLLYLIILARKNSKEFRIIFISKILLRFSFFQITPFRKFCAKTDILQIDFLLILYDTDFFFNLKSNKNFEPFEIFGTSTLNCIQFKF